MNFPEINNTIKHLIKTAKCPECKGKYKTSDVNVIATTQMEGLFEIRCSKCMISSIVTVLIGASSDVEILNSANREHRSISENDILDMKNFLNKFDGNFKKIFSNQK